MCVDGQTQIGRPRAIDIVGTHQSGYPELSLAAKGQRVKSFVFDAPIATFRGGRGSSASTTSLVGESLDAPMSVKRLLIQDILVHLPGLPHDKLACPRGLLR